AQTIHCLEQFATGNLGRSVVYPHPEAILDPRQVRYGVVGFSRIQGLAQSTIAFPQDSWLIDAVDCIVQRNELEIDMQGRKFVFTIVQANKQPGLSDVLTCKRCHQRTELTRDLLALGADCICRFWFDGDHQIQIAELVQSSRGEGARSSNADDAGVSL